jgi:hypothetical protein
MTKTMKLNWRLSKLPTPEEVSKLVNDKIITHDEAREILFSSEEVEERDKKSLESEIKFLREIIERLSNDKNRIVEVIREVEKPIYIKTPWWNDYYTWCGGTTYYNATSTPTFGVTNTAYSLNSLDCTSTPSRDSFTAIKTF